MVSSSIKLVYASWSSNLLFSMEFNSPFIPTRNETRRTSYSKFLYREQLPKLQRQKKSLTLVKMTRKMKLSSLPALRASAATEGQMYFSFHIGIPFV